MSKEESSKTKTTMSDEDQGIEAPPLLKKEDTAPITLPDTDIKKGLTQAQVDAAREKWGWNEIETPSTPLYILFLRQFTGFMSIIILIAAVVAAAVEDWEDMVVILVMLLVNGTHHNES